MQQFTHEQRIAALERIRNGERPIDVARSLQVNVGTLRLWRTREKKRKQRIANAKAAAVAAAPETSPAPPDPTIPEGTPAAPAAEDPAKTGPGTPPEPHQNPSEPGVNDEGTAFATATAAAFGAGAGAGGSTGSGQGPGSQQSAPPGQTQDTIGSVDDLLLLVQAGTSISVRVVVAMSGREVPAEQIDTLASLTPGEIKILRALGPAALPYARQLLLNMPKIAAYGFAGIWVWSLVQRFNSLKHFPKKTKPAARPAPTPAAGQAAAA